VKFWRIANKDVFSNKRSIIKISKKN